MIRLNSILALLFITVVLCAPSFSFAKEACSCPEVTCGPCQKKVTIGKEVKFCDWGDINVCRKVVCENVNYYFSCLSKHEEKKRTEAEETKDLELAYEKEAVGPNKGAEPKKESPVPPKAKPVAVKTPAKEEAPKKQLTEPQKTLPPKLVVSEEPKKTKETLQALPAKEEPTVKAIDGSRWPASTMDENRPKRIQLETAGAIPATNSSRVLPVIEYPQTIIGRSLSDKTNIKVFHRGETLPLKKDWNFYVGDEISNNSGKPQAFTVAFENGKVSLVLFDKSKLLVEDPHSMAGRFQPFFYLIHGGVGIETDLQEGHFDLLAGQILVRSSGGKHQVNYEMGPEGLKVKVESHKNQVAVIRAQDLSGRDILVKEKEFLSWVAETPAALFNQDEKQALANQGFITPIFKMSEDRQAQLGLLSPEPKPLFEDWNKSSKVRQPANKEAFAELCQAPSAGFQQCAWSCEGNPKGSSHCQAEKAQVHCVRRVCNAAGQWGGPTAFASSYKDLCPAEGVRVGDCQP